MAAPLLLLGPLCGGGGITLGSGVSIYSENPAHDRALENGLALGTARMSARGGPRKNSALFSMSDIRKISPGVNLCVLSGLSQSSELVDLNPTVSKQSLIMLDEAVASDHKLSGLRSRSKNPRMCFNASCRLVSRETGISSSSPTLISASIHILPRANAREGGRMKVEADIPLRYQTYST